MLVGAAEIEVEANAAVAAVAVVAVVAVVVVSTPPVFSFLT